MRIWCTEFGKYTEWDCTTAQVEVHGMGGTRTCHIPVYVCNCERGPCIEDDSRHEQQPRRKRGD